MCERYSLTKFANFLIIVLRAGIVTIFEPKVVTISVGQNESCNKICKICKAIFSAHYNIFQPNFGILRFFKRFFPGISFSRLDLSR